MVDNYTVNDVTEEGGDTFAADDAGAAKHPYVKVEFGDDGTQTPVDATKPLPIIPTAGAVDAVTGVLKVIDLSHHTIHASQRFIAWIVDLSMDDNATLILAFKTPAGTKRAHMGGSFATLAGGHVQVWKGATWNQGSGSAVDIRNRKHLASPVSSVLLEDKNQATFTPSDQVVGNPTGLDTESAMLADDTYVFGAAGQGQSQAVGGESSSRAELVLQPDETYAIVFTATAGSNEAQLILDWYEQTDQA